MAKKKKEQKWWQAAIILRATDAVTWGSITPGTETRRYDDWAYATKGEAYRSGERMLNALKKDYEELDRKGYTKYYELVRIEVEEYWK